METTIKVARSVFEANESMARRNQSRMNEAGVLSLNLMSAPGSGKTTLLQRSMARLAPERSAVLVGDLQTSRDADRLASDAVEVCQINTGKGCHLTARQVSDGLLQLRLEQISYLFIEN
ncbi:MAG: GTP-binding protein, partial [Myxococcota bacterium]|nr:GTP-binding protein [Myxococcota bacterium]